MLRWVAVAITTLLLGVMAAGCGSTNQPGSDAGSAADPEIARPRVPVRGVVVRLETVERWLSVTGNLLPIRQSRVSSKIAGRVAAVFVDDGDRVRKGDVLFELDKSDLLLACKEARDSLNAAEARLKAARIRLSTARRDFERVKRLHQRKVIAQEQFDKAQDAYKAAKAGVQIAESAVLVARDALEIAQHKLKECTVRAPIDGYVAKRYVNLGETVTPLSVAPCVVLIDASECKVEASVGDSYQAMVRNGQEVRVRVDGIPDRVITGHVAYVGKTIDPVTRTFTVRVVVPNPDGKLRPGALARLKVLLARRRNVVAVPNGCIMRRAGRHIVFVAASGKAVARRVKLGLEGERLTEITEGLKPGETVITEGTEALEDGSPVELLENPPGK